jgi:hypothetical protein
MGSVSLTLTRHVGAFVPSKTATGMNPLQNPVLAGPESS